MDEDREYPRVLEFRLGRSAIHAYAELIDPFYPHVIKATLQENPWHRWVRAALLWLPLSLQHVVERIWPRYSLPGCVVLKKLRKPAHTAHRAAYENEQAMYRRLARAQGQLVPRYYGEADCEGDRTNVVAFLPWPTVKQQPRPLLSVETFCARVTAAMDEMMRCGAGVVHNDPKMNNIMVADDGRFVFVDLESVYVPAPGKEAKSRAYAIEGFVERYEYLLKCKPLDEEEDEKEESGHGKVAL